MRTIIWLGIYAFISTLEKHWGLYDEKIVKANVPIVAWVLIFCVALDLLKK